MTADLGGHPVGFVRRLTEPALRDADVVWACTPDGRRSLLRATVDGRPLDFAEAIRLHPADDLHVLEVPCHDEDDVALLRSLVERRPS
jgi:hypothetical protein